MATHNPNPFDFVPFAAEEPELKPLEGWTQCGGTLCTGYLDVQLEAWTPVHIVGDQEARRRSYLQKGQERSNYKITHSDFYQRNGIPLIPSSTIRGCLRAFLEATCNCWASQLTPYYEKVSHGQNRRHIGFYVLDSKHPDVKKADKNKIYVPLGNAVPREFYPDPKNTEYIDLASYLFGCVLSKEQNNESSPGFKGRIMIEDAFIKKNLSSGDAEYRYTIPDIDDSAFMGGGKPSASSWWYMFPYGIRMRSVKGRKGRPGFYSCEFIGKGFRGRKFYYHQHPKACVDWYFNKSNWPVRDEHPLYRIQMDCLPPETSTDTFRIYFQDLPEQFVKLLLFILSPSENIRHKLGYGKAYGYGAVKFTLSGLTLRRPRQKKNREARQQQTAACEQNLRQYLDHPYTLYPDVSHWLHQGSLDKLAQILWYPPESSLMFTYPPFDKSGFQCGIRAERMCDFLDQTQYDQFQNEQFVPLTQAEAKALATHLNEENLRTALHFEVYQEHANGYTTIQNRKTLRE